MTEEESDREWGKGEEGQVRRNRARAKEFEKERNEVLESRGKKFKSLGYGGVKEGKIGEHIKSHK